MAFSTAGGGPLRAEINITPMIDILLVLIIVFMVVVSMSQPKGLKAQIPQPAPDRRVSRSTTPMSRRACFMTPATVTRRPPCRNWTNV